MSEHYKCQLCNGTGSLDSDMNPFDAAMWNRTAACVNAMKGIADPAEAMAKVREAAATITTQAAEIARLTAERDAAREDAKRMRERLDAMDMERADIVRIIMGNSECANLPPYVRSAVDRMNDAEADIEILMEAVDQQINPTVGPACFTHMGEAAQNEIRLRIERLEKARQSTETWKRDQIACDQMDAATATQENADGTE